MQTTVTKSDSISPFVAALTAQRAEVIFLSALHQDEQYTPAQILAEVHATVAREGGQGTCSGACADQYFSHTPETAAPRMTWALLLAASTITQGA